MKTSPKTPVALLAILALGGSTAGSLFSESLQSNVINTIGTAGAFFPDTKIQTPIQQVAIPSNTSDSETDSGVIALPIEVNTVNPDVTKETQVRAITNVEANPTPMPEPTVAPEPTTSPEPTGSPEARIEPSPMPEVSPEASASSAPETTPESE